MHGNVTGWDLSDFQIERLLIFWIRKMKVEITCKYKFKDALIHIKWGHYFRKNVFSFFNFLSLVNLS